MVRLGESVIYRSKIDNGPGNEVMSPAIVIRTKDTTVRAVIDRWGPEPASLVSARGSVHTTAPRPDAVVAELPDDETVDLVVFGLGKDYREYTVTHGRRKGDWCFPWEAEPFIVDDGYAVANTIASEKEETSD